MKKVSINNSWLVFLPVIGILFFVVFPQLQRVGADFNREIIEHETNVYKLDSLKQIANPNQKAKNEIAKLEILVPVHETAIARRKYKYLKHGGTVVIVLVFLTLFFGYSYVIKRKKSSPKNRKVSFTFSDPYVDHIGQQISWNPVKNSGSNFVSTALEETRSGYKIAPSNFMKYIAWGFIILGINPVVWTFVEAIQLNQETITFMKAGNLFFTSGGIFMLPGFFLLFQVTPTKIYVNKQKQTIKVEGETIGFNQLHALQVLHKFIQGSKTGGYYCYELNLVTKQGERFNLLNHGDKTFMLSDMVKISNALKLPVWNMGVE
ncbi:hypothetical protein [uncultured Tenacibaculum sp.]|uniref:hypothetical protein n=1 Tax=uncultured Tenacibaculum sp. TaxID=174713 RepID=UPI002603D099|nr:hypothetical protein [uncultured Tenacibaculum sp.]